MNPKIGRTLKRIAVRFKRRNYIEQSVLREWFAVNGDRTFRLDYDLGCDSVVFDAGGYEGQWSSDIFSRFLCDIHIFEPVNSHAKTLERRFAANRKIKVNNFGLSSTTRVETMRVARGSSSAINLEEPGLLESAHFVSLKQYLSENNLNRIDLLKLNVEGMEYELIEHILDTDIAGSIHNIQVQFHAFVPAAETRMKRIQERLSATHHITYRFPFVWENWRLNGLGSIKTLAD